MKFYFDMDGVIVKFDYLLPNSAEFNHPSDTLDEKAKAAKKQFWHTVEQTPDFWHNMPMMPNAGYMLSVAHEHGEVFVLSKTPGAKHFITGQKYVNFVANEKRAWISKNLPYFFNESHVIICDGNKGKLIKPTRYDILIDDRQENIDDWLECGGRGILFRNANDVANKIISHDFISKNEPAR